MDAAYAAHAHPILNVQTAPVSLSTCTDFHSGSGTLLEPTYVAFNDYLAHLVAYYNLGSFTDGSGTHSNPHGTSRRVDYWEIWNEPDLPYEFPCLLPDTSPSLTPAAYATMWNAVAPKMKAVDPTVQLIEPTVASVVNQTYIQALLADGSVPEGVSAHTSIDASSAVGSMPVTRTVEVGSDVFVHLDGYGLALLQEAF